MNERNGCLFLQHPQGDAEAPRARHDWSALGALVRAQALKALADQFLLHAQQVQARLASVETSS
ncbi:MAG: hypothetical protein IT449_06015 [Phycisphaerales bacterium]|nr:hypothetical protein [Phycisphaerales bacterium]